MEGQGGGEAQGVADPPPPQKKGLGGCGYNALFMV
jgi:hypothetical protein